MNAKPDGYTIGLAITTGMTVTPMVEDFDFDWEDLNPIGAFYGYGMTIAVSKDSPHKTAEEFFAYVKENPGEVDTGVPTPTSPRRSPSRPWRSGTGWSSTLFPWAPPAR